jgi:hypothetical protein
MIVARIGDVLAVIAIPVALAVAAWLRDRRRADTAPQPPAVES